MKYALVVNITLVFTDKNVEDLDCEASEYLQDSQTNINEYIKDVVINGFETDIDHIDVTNIKLMG